MSITKLTKPPPTWQPRAKLNRVNDEDNSKKFYAIQSGKVKTIDLKDIHTLKIKDESRKLKRGQIFSLEMPESLVKKYTEPQTKLWYYDRRNYPKERLIEEETLPPVFEERPEINETKNQPKPIETETIAPVMKESSVVSLPPISMVKLVFIFQF